MKYLKPYAAIALIAAFLASPAALMAADKAPKKAPKPYPLATCAVSGEKLEGGDMEPYVFTHEGREVKLCCKDCLTDFKKESAKFVAKIDEAAKKVKPYPLGTCIVSDEKLGEMGDPYVFIQDGQEVKLCCKNCMKDFKKETAKYMGKLKDAPKKPAK